MSVLRRAAQILRAPGKKMEGLVQYLDKYEGKPYEPRPVDKFMYLFQSKRDLEDWEVQCDAELGGKSLAKLETTRSGKARFYGLLNTETPDWLTASGYAGMFTAEKRQNAVLEIMQSAKITGDGQYKGFEIRLRGDGRQWKMNCQEEQFRRLEKEMMFQFILNTRGGPEYEIFRIPFSKFIRTARGGYIQSQEMLEFDLIKSIGFLLSDSIDGPFNLEVDYIKLIHIPFCEDFDKMDRRRPRHSNLMRYEDL